jgi:hypothetical protein
MKRTPYSLSRDGCSNAGLTPKGSGLDVGVSERWIRVVSLMGLVTTLGLGAGPASATAIAHSDLVFHDLAITPSAGTVEFTGPWILQAHASASNSLGELDSPPDVQMDGPGTVSVSAAVTWASAKGVATDPAPTPPYLDISGGAVADGDIPGAITGSAIAEGRGTVRRDRQDPPPMSYFQILGGTTGDPVDVTFDVLIDYSLLLQTDQYGQLAEAEAIFGQELLGQDVGFVLVNWLDQYWSIGPNDFHQEEAANLLLTNTLQLQYGTVYTLLNEGDAEIRVENVPEPSTLWLLTLVMPLLARKNRRV